ncbi:uncharacterized protein K452DRAFT_325103 [Aplosporella prunicola CBS 121167]|uniref:N-acetyltransferase domain-containing protein n=1 Tax=Aplosporella prunicola CBS 121167 TaxID=1176127 RepID=A0A6A6BNX0_9PEZI|nr:uncharacterized protein K452DRAFT_325103 [Aplosporella prunicola CBS 121167]KAF2144547.1 hypothetical protein K452DRAFT_325103 [Aplosporella prunicola CBS 121167]
MPAMLDDPASPPIYRQSGPQPFPAPNSPLPEQIKPRSLILRDRTTKASLIPFSSYDQVPLSLLSYLCQQLNREIEKGDTYPMMELFTEEKFGPYWFQNFGAVMLLGEVQSQDEVRQMAADGANWEKTCLGSFYVKPNYPGRSSHICNGGFLVTDAARNRGVGRLMGENYLEWAPKLGYTYSVFNLVYETNVASCRIWDALGFKRIGRVPACGNLRSSPELVDAIIYGRHLGYSPEEADAEERFEKIKYYLKTGEYPGDADRAEKSRLRSAAAHYTLAKSDDNGVEKLMMGKKEVVISPKEQYRLARTYHRERHFGINKTTSVISEKYHWPRIKLTVTEVINNCDECQEKDRKKRRSSEKAERPRANLSKAASLGAEEAVEDLPSPGDTQPNVIDGGEHVPPGVDAMMVDPQIMNREGLANEHEERLRESLLSAGYGRAHAT